MNDESAPLEGDVHLSDDQLSAYVHAKMDSVQLAAAERHLLVCETCSRQLDTVADEPHGFADHVRSLLKVRAVDETLHGTVDFGDDYLTRTGSAAPPTSASARRRQRFRKQKIIGQGGMGLIWQTFDSLVRRQVALKELRPEKSYSPKHLARFKREVLLTAKLSHPGTVFVLDYSDTPGDAYYVMNLVQGQTLTKLIEKYHRERVEQRADFSDFITLLNTFISVGQTIAYAHSEGILHRDIKSDNVMVGKFGEVTLIDWGLAKTYSSKHSDESISHQPPSAEPTLSESLSVRTTVEGQSLGTPAFMSPEQAKGAIGEIDFRTDTYMLTAMLYEILTGSPPFDDTDVDTVIQRVIADMPLPARERVSACPATLEQICIKGLAKLRERRYQSAADLVADVKHWIAGRADRATADRQFKSLFEAAFDAMGIVDFRRGLQNLNAAWRTKFGWDPNEITGRTHYEMIHPDDQVRAARALSRANRKKVPQQVTVRLLCQDGRYQWSEWSLAPYVEEASVFIIGRIVDEPVS